MNIEYRTAELRITNCKKGNHGDHPSTMLRTGSEHKEKKVDLCKIGPRITWRKQGSLLSSERGVRLRLDIHETTKKITAVAW